MLNNMLFKAFLSSVRGALGQQPSSLRGNPQASPRLPLGPPGIVNKEAKTVGNGLAGGRRRHGRSNGRRVCVAQTGEAAKDESKGAAGHCQSGATAHQASRLDATECGGPRGEGRALWPEGTRVDMPVRRGRQLGIKDQVQGMR